MGHAVEGVFRVCLVLYGSLISVESQRASIASYLLDWLGASLQLHPQSSLCWQVGSPIFLHDQASNQTGLQERLPDRRD
jgi:hypothetical protein